jgi:Mn2+/Fe2+ NRAMP family transporter
MAKVMLRLTPSGRSTGLDRGAQAGFGLLWPMSFTYPLIAVTQEISARLGRTTGCGLAGKRLITAPSASAR